MIMLAVKLQIIKGPIYLRIIVFQATYLCSREWLRSYVVFWFLSEEAEHWIKTYYMIQDSMIIPFLLS